MAMLTFLVGVLIVFALIALLLIYLEVIDTTEMIMGALKAIAALVKLAAGVVFMIGAFFVYLLTRRPAERKDAAERDRNEAS